MPRSEVARSFTQGEPAIVPEIGATGGTPNARVQAKDQSPRAYAGSSFEDATTSMPVVRLLNGKVREALQLIEKRFPGSALVQLGRYLFFFRVRWQTTPHKLLRDSRHALAEVFGGPKIGFGWRNVRPLIGVRLCRSTEPEA
jgi:hypothetical protein